MIITMATKQMCKQAKPAWETSSSTKPVNQLKSSLLVKKLVAMSISHIVYLRGLLPEEAFMDREMDGVPVKIIYEKSQFAPAVQIVKWLKGAFEAFDKKYLEKMEFIFFVDEPTEPRILECYSFSFTYGDDQISVSCGTSHENQPKKKFRLDEIRFATVQLLRHTTILMQNMRKITENLSMKVRLYYYDEVTPEDYEPPGFEKAPDTEYVFEPNCIKIRHGIVDTGFHSIKLNSRVGPSRIQEENELASKVRETAGAPQRKKSGNKTPPTESMECNTTFQPPSRNICSITTEEPDENNVQMEVEMENHISPSQGESCAFVKETPTDVQNASVHCACGNSEDQGILIFCEICRRWNHAVCYRFLNEKSVPKSFCCIFCHGSISGAYCNDQSLLILSERDRKMICLYRRALVFCLSSWRVDQKILSSELSIPPEIADDLLIWMESDQVFSNKRKRGKGPYHHINETHLRDVIIPAYFEKAMVKLPSISKKYSRSEDDSKSPENENPIKAKLRKANYETSTVKLVPRK